MSIILTYDHFPCPPTWVINFNTRVLTCNLKLDSSREYIFEVQRNPLPTHVSKVSTCHEIPLPTHLSEASTIHRVGTSCTIIIVYLPDSHSGVLRWAKISLAHFSGRCYLEPSWPAHPREKIVSLDRIFQLTGVKFCCRNEIQSYLFGLLLSNWQNSILLLHEMWPFLSLFAEKALIPPYPQSFRSVIDLTFALSSMSGGGPALGRRVLRLVAKECPFALFSVFRV